MVCRRFILLVHDFLTYACLYFLIHARVRETYQQAVGPWLVHNPESCHYRFIMVCVIEPPHMLFLFTVDSTGFKIFHRRINPIVVIGIVLKSIQLPLEAVSQSLPCIDV